MEDLTKEDLFQILEFYKSKISQQELTYLVLQLETNKKIKSLNDKIDSDRADYLRNIEIVQNHSVVLVENEKKIKQKEIENIIKKYEKINNTVLEKKITK